LIQQQRVSAAQQQQLLAETLERVATLAGSAGKVGGSDSGAAAVASIQAKLSIGTVDGPSAAGHTVTLRQLGFNKDRSVTEQSDASGSVDFGYCDLGRYEIEVEVPWRFKSAPRRFTLHPGTTEVVQFICPSKPEEARVRFVVNIPDDLAELGVQALVDRTNGELTVADEAWRETAAVRHILIRNDGWEWLVVGNEMPVGLATSGGRAGVPAPVQRRAWKIQRHSNFHQSVFRTGMRYSINSLRLVVPFHRHRQTPSVRRVQFVEYEQIAPKPPTTPMESSAQPAHPSAPSHPLNIAVVVDDTNDWVIPIPEELINEARAYLEENPPPPLPPSSAPQREP
jgi:hypothetical protein